MKKRSISELVAGLKRLHASNSSILTLLLILLLFLLNNGLRSPENVMALISGNTGLFIAVLGLGIVMVSGGIDFSLGYQISMISMVISLLSTARVSDWIVIVCALAAGLLCGALNGVLVGYLDIPPFAATIASQIIFHGVSYSISKGRMVSYVAESVRSITKLSVIGIRIDIILAIACAVLFSYILRNSFWGKELRSIGLDEETAMRARVPIRKVKFLSYTVAGLFYSIAAMVLTSKRGYAGSEVGVGLEITAIAAAYIGGVLTLATTQRVFKLGLGVLVIALLESNLQIVNANNSIQYIVTGVILILFLAVNRKTKNRMG